MKGKCKVCSKVIPSKSRYCSKECKQSVSKNSYQNTQYVISWRKRQKVKAVEYKGGKCERCGYNKCLGALTFHHLDPTQKDFIISQAQKGWDKTKLELDKCALLCANCHAEEHWNDS